MGLPVAILPRALLGLPLRALLALAPGLLLAAGLLVLCVLALARLVLARCLALVVLALTFFHCRSPGGCRRTGGWSVSHAR